MSLPPAAVLEFPSRNRHYPTARSTAVADSSPGRAPETEESRMLTALIARMQQRDQVALARLFDVTAARLHAVALRIVRNPAMAEEVLSDTYFQAWRDSGRYDRTRGRVLAWLMIICRTRALDALRRQDEAFSHPDPHELGGVEPESGQEDNPAELLILLQGNRRVQKALKALSAVQRQLVALAFFKGLTHAEIAEHQGMPLGTVKTHIRKALSVLKENLGADYRDDADCEVEA